MCWPVLAVNQYVIEEYKNVLLQLRFENCVHRGLERGWGIVESEGHNTEFVVVVVSRISGRRLA